MKRLVLGTAQFGLDYGIANQNGRPSLDDVRATLDMARQFEIPMLDTAMSYGDCEDRLGRIGVEDFDVVTKLPRLSVESGSIREDIFRQASQSLKRLGLSRLGAMLLHRPEQLLEEKTGEEIFGALRDLKEEGLVEKIGYSIYSPDELDALHDRFRADVVQGPFSVIDRRLFHSGWMDRLKDDGVELHVRSVFLQGLLLMTRKERPIRFDRWADILDAWDHHLDEHRIDAVTAALNYVLGFEEVDRVVVGVDTALQLAGIVEATSKACPDVPDIASRDPELVNPSRWQS